MSDDLNPAYIFQTIAAQILASIARGDVDPVVLAKRELASRGLDQNGKWVGFAKAAEIHGIKN